VRRGRCPFKVQYTPTIVGRRWTIWQRKIAWGRFVSEAAAEKVREAYCAAWRRGEPDPVGFVAEQIGTRVPFKEPGRPKGYILRLPGAG
jgi:hypothetical protein